jgi:uroporphyrinogen decarboxylase
MLSRREFALAASAGALYSAPLPKLSSRERVDRALKGADVDHPPCTLWHHFLDEKHPGEIHARNTLEFHRKFRTDLVKVMSDYPYPKPNTGPWHALKVDPNPFPQQIRALELIREGLKGEAYFIETIFNSFNQAQKLSSLEEVQKLKAEKPQVLLDALAVITKSQISHARKALAAGASGIFLAIANAGDGILTREEYARFSEPFDRMILEAVLSAPLNTLHLHGRKIFLDRFYNWPAPVINYSIHWTGVSVAEVRKHYSGVLMCGLDEDNYPKLSEAAIKAQWQAARKEAGPKYFLAPGCSVPNDSTDEQLSRLAKVVGA